MILSPLLYVLVTVSLQSVFDYNTAVLVQLRSQIRWVQIHIVLLPIHFIPNKKGRL